MTSAVNTDRLGKLLALASSDNEAEALAAMRKARELLASGGMDFVVLAQRVCQPQPQASHSAAPASPFAGRDMWAEFSDHMEAKEPGWKAKQAAEAAERNCRRAQYRAQVLKKYGSAEAALAPCSREQLLRKALGKQVVDRNPPYERWADTVGGMSHCSYFFDFRDVSRSVRHAIETAYPLPVTITEAHAEYALWEEREREMAAVMNWNTGDTALDLVAYARWERVRMLLETELHVRNFNELLFRSRYYRGLETQCDDIEEALHRDLERLVEAQGVGISDPSPAVVQPGHLPARASERRAQVLAMLSTPDTSEWSDRAIAKAAGVSPTTVGVLRRKSGGGP